MRTLCCLVAVQSLLAADASAAKVAETMRAAARSGKYTYVMFYRADDSATRDMTAAINQQVSRKSAQTSWVRVDVTDRSSMDIVKKYNASRLPMPAVMGVAPNGAITGVYPLKVSQQQLDKAILTPRYSEMVKKLQSQKVAVVCLQPARGGSVPAGVTQLERDATLKGLVARVDASAADVNEARFFERMRVQTDIQKPVVLVFAPPGVFVGRYNANVSGKQLAEAIHKSGKCSCEACRNKNKKK